MDVSLVSLVSPEPSAPAKPDLPASETTQFDKLLVADARSARANAAPTPSTSPAVPSGPPPAAASPPPKPANDRAASQPSSKDGGGGGTGDPTQTPSAAPPPSTTQTPATGTPDQKAAGSSNGSEAQPAATPSGNAGQPAASADPAKGTDNGNGAVGPVPVIATLIAAIAAQAAAAVATPPGVATASNSPGSGAAAPVNATPDLSATLNGSAAGASAGTTPQSGANGAAGSEPANAGSAAAPTTADASAAAAAADFAALAAASATASAALTTAANKGAATLPANTATASTGKTAAEALAQLNSANVEVKIAASGDAGQSALGDTANNQTGAGPAPSAPPPTAAGNTVSSETLLLSQLAEIAHHLEELAGMPAGPDNTSGAPTATADGNAAVGQGAPGGEAATQTGSANAPSAPPARPMPLLLPLIDQVLPNLSQAANGDGAGRFTIQLRPPELGKVQVELKIAQDGHVTASIVADRQDTLALLQRDSHQLEQALSDAGLSANAGDLQFSLSGDSAGTNFDEPNSSSFNAGIAAAVAATPDEPDAPTIVRQIAGLSLVDLHV